MAAEVARQLRIHKKIELVLCFSPSVNVAYDFRAAMEQRTGLRFDGELGAHGRSMTYQAMLSLSDDFWALFERNRILVIFDEIHHCAGQELARANSWGQKIIKAIQGRAAFTLALTGTPWRSDRIPISLSSYCEEGKIHCDFSYGLREAVSDFVCRLPRICLVDNDNIQVDHIDAVTGFSSISELLSSSLCSYQTLIENEDLITFVLKKASSLLETIRQKSPNAGGLIVASSVMHAYEIARLLHLTVGEKACVVTHQSDEAQYLINRFKRDSMKWIISVGMISEGTNIPRWQVCCHLTRIRTELHFRQVLGRVLRQTSNYSEVGHLIIPAATEFIEFSKRISEEIPGTAEVNFLSMHIEDSSDGNHEVEAQSIRITQRNSESDFANVKAELFIADASSSIGKSDTVGDIRLNLFGRYRTELLSLTRHIQGG